MKLTRRQFVGTTMAGAMAAPFVSRVRTASASTSVLRVIPHADLQNIDPIWTTAYISRNHGYMVFDTLFAMDESLTPQPQMVDTYERSSDGLTWTFVLRDGLEFHDGAAVTADDCVASLTRWGVRDGMGQKLFQQVESLEAADDKTIVMNLATPYGLVLESIGKISSNVPFMMPKRLAETDPFEQIPDVIGSGPYRFVTDEWQPGALTVYEKFEGYVPRSEPANSASGGKVVNVDRCEWIYTPDATTAMNALISGEVDYYEQVPGDLAPIIAQSEGVNVEVLDNLGNQGMLRFNHLLPPFDNPMVRRAVLQAMDKTKYMQAAVGNPDFFNDQCDSYFPCGSPLETDAGLDMITPPDIERARATLEEAGYDGTPVVIMQSTDIPILSAMALVTAETLRDIGMEVDVQAMDWSTLTSRRALQEPVSDGGWNIFHTWWIGGDIVNPISAVGLSGGGSEAAWFGWPEDAQIEELRDAFANEPDPAAQQELGRQIQQRAIEIGTHGNTGTFFVPVGYRDNVAGLIKSPVQFFWNISV
ncbi:MAG: ABC transporter substrate-binding protein [Pseudomonadota bacterium]